MPVKALQIFGSFGPSYLAATGRELNNRLVHFLRYNDAHRPKFWQALAFTGSVLSGPTEGTTLTRRGDTNSFSKGDDRRK